MTDTPSAPPVRLAVAFRSPAVNEAMCCCLGLDPGLQVATAGEQFSSILQHLQQHRPDILLADLSLLDGSVVRLAEQMKADRTPTDLVVWAPAFPDGTLQLLLEQNVRGFLLDSELPHQMIQHILQVSRGRFAASQGVREQLQESSDVPGGYAVKRHSAVARLSPRQFDILERLARGGTVKEVARELELTEKSVESHKYRLMKLLELRDRLQLTRFAIREGIVTA